MIIERQEGRDGAPYYLACARVGRIMVLAEGETHIEARQAWIETADRALRRQAKERGLRVVWDSDRRMAL